MIILSLLNTLLYPLLILPVIFETDSNLLSYTTNTMSPVQNRAVQEVDLGGRADAVPPCPASSPPSSQIATALPSGQVHTVSSNVNDEKTFFENVSYKKAYFNLHKALSKQEKCASRIWFLKKCARFNVLPPTSVIKANHNVRFSNVASQNFQVNLQNVSLENLKIGIVEENKHLDLCKNQLRSVKISVHGLISEPNLHLFLEEKVYSDKSKLKKQYYNVHKNKLCFLLHKNNRPIPRELQSNNDLVNNSSTAKKSRKFVKRTKYRRKIKRQNKSLNSLVTNYSNIELTKDMSNLLNRGLNFAVTPKSVNTTDIHAGFQKLGRSMRWRETLYKEDDIDNSASEPLPAKQPWHKAKFSFPRAAPSTDLNTFINGSLACVLGSDLNKIHTNLPESERRALNELNKLQKSRQITIKPNDKTGGCSVLNTSDYIESMEILLKAKHTDANGQEHPYFQELEANMANQIQFNDHERLKSEVNKAKKEGWIDSDTAKWLIPDESSPGRLYGLVKDHVVPEKWPPGTTIPPLRPVESASGTTFENASHFVDIHSNHLVKSLPSYWEDTPDMLRCFEQENQKGPQPAGSIPVTLDVSSLYTNIPLDEGINIFEKFLETRSDKSVPTAFLITLLTLVLTCNVLVFNNTYFLQHIGTAMGTRVAPTFACLFMGAIECLMLTSWKGIKPHLYKRYIDDIFFFWTGTERQLLKFIEHLNNFHPYLKFKASYNFETKSVEFLDTVISIDKNGYIKTDLFVKPGKKCSYLLTSSCHPSHITENIPYSLALRLKRICSDNLDFVKQLDILKDLLLTRGYKQNYILKAFERVSLIDRLIALRKVDKKIVNRPILSLQYDPRLPHISNVLFKFWKVMTQNPLLKKIFPEAPMVCWTRPKNLRECLIRAKLPKILEPKRPSRNKIGFKHCGYDCILCKFSPKFADNIVSSVTKEKFPILSNLTCNSENIIYCITCTKDNGNCKTHPQYIGQTGRKAVDRFREHRNSIEPNSVKTVGQHFSQNGHNPCHLQFIPFEQLKSENPWIRLAREKFYIRKFESLLNRRT